MLVSVIRSINPFNLGKISKKFKSSNLIFISGDFCEYSGFSVFVN